MRSDCRGEARNTSAPNRAMSYRDADAAIISIAQQARPKPMGQIDDSRAQLSTRSMLVVMKLSSNLWSIRPMRRILVRCQMIYVLTLILLAPAGAVDAPQACDPVYAVLFTPIRPHFGRCEVCTSPDPLDEAGTAAPDAPPPLGTPRAPR